MRYWRNAAKSKPPEYEFVLVRLGLETDDYLRGLHGGFDIAYYVSHSCHEGWESDPGSPLAYVSHWMPLPKPPRGT